MKRSWPRVKLRECLKQVSRPERVDPAKTYQMLGAHWYAQGLYIKATLTGANIRASKVYRVEKGDFVYNRLFAWKGAFALASEADDGCYVSNEFPCFTVRRDRIDGKYLWLYFSRRAVWDEALGLSSGGTPTSRNRLKEERFLSLKILLPPLEEQRRIVAFQAKVNALKKLQEETAKELDALMPAILDRALKGEL